MMSVNKGNENFPITTHIEIKCKDPQKIIDAMKPDMTPTSKFEINVKSNKNILIINVSANDVSSALAGINSYLRLVKSIEKL